MLAALRNPDNPLELYTSLVLDEEFLQLPHTINQPRPRTIEKALRQVRIGILLHSPNVFPTWTVSNALNVKYLVGFAPMEHEEVGIC
jgi:hypothetical protein